jgi:hypothetical protein
MAIMNEILNQLVGLCAGRGGLLRLERRKLLEEFKRLPDNHEDKVECLLDCQLCMGFVSVLADTGKDFARRSFLKLWEQSNHEITFRHRQRSLGLAQPIRHDGMIKILDPFALLQIRPINSTSMPTQQSQHHRNFTIPPTWSGEHKASFPPTVLPVPSVLSRPKPCKIGRGHQEAAKRVTDINSVEALKLLPGRNGLPHRFHTEATMGHTDIGVNLRRRNTKPVYLDKFEAEMRALTIKLIRERNFRHEIVLGGPENRHRVRVGADVAGTSPEEMEQARQSTTTRGHYGLPYQLSDAGKVDVYRNTHAMKGRRDYRGWVGR